MKRIRYPKSMSIYMFVFDWFRIVRHNSAAALQTWGKLKSLSPHLDDIPKIKQLINTVSSILIVI